MTPEEQAYVFVQGIVLSCETHFHFAAADALIDLYRRKFPDDKIRKGLLLDQRAMRFHQIFPEK